MRSPINRRDLASAVAAQDGMRGIGVRRVELVQRRTLELLVAYYEPEQIAALLDVVRADVKREEMNA